MSDGRTVGDALPVTVNMRRRGNPSMGGPTEFDRQDAARYLEALGVPVDFPAADLPRAIAAWKRMEADLAMIDDDDGDIAWDLYHVGWNNCLAYLRGDDDE